MAMLRYPTRIAYCGIAILGGLLTSVHAQTTNPNPTADQYGHLGIGTTAPHPSSMLDIASNDAGILVPRLTSAQRGLISSPVLSLMLFNTDVNEFQYFTSTGIFSGWDAFITTANANKYAWQLTGNSATNPATNFLGTTDAVDLTVRTNNVERMRIGSNGNVGIGTAPNTDMVNVAGNINTSTQYNIGSVRVLSNGGTDNLFAGVGSGGANAGSSNTFVGKDAGLSNTTGSENTFLGHSSGGQNTDGSQNTFLGNSAGNANATPGSGNTYVGYNADGASGLTNATAIGANAVVSQNNSLVLGNNANVGVGTSTPMVAMDINGGAAIQPATADFATSAVGAGTNVSPRVLSLTVGNRSYFRITSDGAAVGPLLQGFPTIRRVDLTNGSQIGQVLVVECINNGNSFRILDGSNVNVDGLGFDTLDGDDTIMLIWNGSKWLEVSRSAN